MTQAELRVRDLTVRYGKVVALRHVAMHIDPGEIVSIIGPNGAGKTTLLSAIAGLVPATVGEITYEQQSLLGAPLERTVRCGIAMVPEGRHVFAGLTVLENLQLGATIRNDASAVEAEIEEYFDQFPILGERRHGHAGLLSGGEQQMLVIVRALLAQPRLLMLDEPSLGLAPRVTEQIYDIIRRVRDDGVTVLVVEQNAGRALAASDRTYVISGGEIRLTGPSTELEKHPGFEAAYFGLGEGVIE
ncbi:MAG: ABC transporter ATP-binding protein [Pseudomonadota bacterium]